MSTEIFFQHQDLNVPLTVDDRIFLGEGLFETLRVSKAKPCYPEQHWQRLKKAACFLSIPFSLSLELWLEKLNQFIHLQKITEGGIKVILAAGQAPRGLLPRARQSHLMFNAFQYAKAAKPQKLVSAAWQRDGQNPIYQLKSVNYLEAIIARRQAEAAEADDVLFFNLQNQATETTVANLFIIKNSALLTPSLHCGVLAGVIRQRLLSLCKEQGIDCFETELNRENIMQAEGAFTTNALQGIRRIASCDDHLFKIDPPLIEKLEELLLKDRVFYAAEGQ